MVKPLALYSTATIGILAVGGTLALITGHRSGGENASLKSETATAWQLAPDNVRELTIPSGTTLSLTLDDGVGSAASRVDDPVRAHVSRDVIVDGVTAIPQQSELSGAVTVAERSGRVKGRAHLALRFDTIWLAGQSQRYDIRTATINRTAPRTTRKDALEIGLPAAGGAAVGALLGGKKGALIGGAVGGGAGTAAVLSTRGPDVRLSRGAKLSVKLVEALTVRVHTPRKEHAVDRPARRERQHAQAASDGGDDLRAGALASAR